MILHRSVPLILNVDDDDGGRYAVSRDLKRGGYEVVEARTGCEAIETTTQHQPDLVLLDVNLPDINGFEVCRLLKADPVTSSIPILHISASYLDDSSRAKGLNSGADGYLTEPVDPAVLNATVKSLLRMKAAEQALRETAGQWQATFDAISDGIAIRDQDGKVVRANRALQAMAAEHGVPATGIFEVLFSNAGVGGFPSALLSGRRETAELVHAGKVLRVTCDPVISEAGTASACVCIVSDITENRRMEEQLRHAQKLESIGILAGGVAHDFNNLLTGILGNASLALDSRPSPQMARYLEDVVKAGERAADLARQLLAYAGKGRFFVRRVDVASVIREVQPLIQAGMPRKVEIALDLAPDLPHVEGDPSLLGQIFMNLMINGAEAIGDNAGTVTVRAEVRHMTEEAVRQKFLSADAVETADYVCVTVEDTGCGMDAETQSRIFDPFFTTKFLGRGLGLAAALGIVRQHRGGIRVQSAPGAGTTFEVAFPATVRAKEPEGTVLVVDDEEVVRSTARMTLEKFGYRVVLAENGLQGVEAFAGQPDLFSAVLLDLTMPVMGGAEALERILAIRADAAVVLTSGYDEAEVLKTVGNVKIASFLQKPFTSGRLGQKIREVLQRRGAGATTS